MGDRTLRACLMGLVLVNLLFVHLTQAAQPGWLLALAALTVASPALIPFRERLAYRAAWNLGVMGVFGMLVHHATGENLRYVLSDALVLAALCQVHLLNNLRSEQRPDLMFLNSFLIALVTGFLSQDLTFALAFAAYVPLLVVGLCVYGLVSGGRRVEAEARRRVVLDGLLRSAVLGASTLLVFLFWPRDFERQGLLAEHMNLGGSGSQVDFSETLSLEQGGEAAASDEIVLRVRVAEGGAAAVPSLWRGATLMGTNGNRWWPFADGELGRGFAADDPWKGAASGLVRGSPDDADVTRVEVEKLDGRLDRLFAPLDARRLWFGPEARGVQVIANADGTLSYAGERGDAPPVDYALGLTTPAPERLGGRPRRVLPRDLRAYAELPETPALAGAHRLADELLAELPDRGEREAQHVIVAHFSDHLSASYPYLAPGAEGASEDLNAFLDGGAGHCEFFASALATMLRSRGIPCRLATGYRSREWSADGTVLTVRRRHAHAWVEVLDPRAGWYAVDPNPVPAEVVPSGFAAWRSELMAAYVDLKADLQKAWNQLTSFDTDRRTEVLAGLRDAALRAVHYVSRNSWAIVSGWLVVLLVAFAARALARPAVAPQVRRYRTAVRRARLVPEPGETPRELLARAAGLVEDAGRLRELEEATRAHELARYG